MSIECGECEFNVYQGHAEGCSLGAQYPPCAALCPCGNPCADVQGERHTEQHTQALYKHSLQHYCYECSEV
jgi:hypothetical protein